jgi:hypothetical protein
MHLSISVLLLLLSISFAAPITDEKSRTAGVKRPLSESKNSVTDEESATRRQRLSLPLPLHELEV